MRYKLENMDGYGYGIIDTQVEDGENSLVGGSVHLAEAEKECAHWNQVTCEDEKCQECCPHDEWDHDQCMDCEKERCPGIAIDRAMDYLEDR